MPTQCRKPHGAWLHGAWLHGAWAHVACFFDRPGVLRRVLFAHMRSSAAFAQCTLSLFCCTALLSYLLRLVTKPPSARTKLEVRSTATRIQLWHKMQRATCSVQHARTEGTEVPSVLTGYSRVLKGTA